MFADNNLAEPTNIVFLARQKTVYAAPFDSMAYNGMQLTAALKSVRSLARWTASAVPAALTYVVDGWSVGANTAGGEIDLEQRNLTARVIRWPCKLSGDIDNHRAGVAGGERCLSCLP